VAADRLRPPLRSPKEDPEDLEVVVEDLGAVEEGLSHRSIQQT
jgi:hypothetical protein